VDLRQVGFPAGKGAIPARPPLGGRYKLSYSQGLKGFCGKPKLWRATGSGTRLKLHSTTDHPGIPQPNRIKNSTAGRTARAAPSFRTGGRGDRRKGKRRRNRIFEWPGPVPRLVQCPGNSRTDETMATWPKAARQWTIRFRRADTGSGPRLANRRDTARSVRTSTSSTRSSWSSARW
jgi:hypothetical protein